MFHSRTVEFTDALARQSPTRFHSTHDTDPPSCGSTIVLPSESSISVYSCRIELRFKLVISN